MTLANSSIIPAMRGTARAAAEAVPSASSLSFRRVLQVWWPLAASWFLMGLEAPAISAIVARLANPEVNLAAYGSLIMPLAFFVEAPIIMLLTASNVLCRDWASYRKIRAFMHGTSAALTLVHVAIAFTPLYGVFVRVVFHMPPETIGPGRIGLMIMVPWTWAIAYRRFNQGVLIRFGHSLTVGVGTLIRLSADGVVLACGFLVGTLSGTVVASSATVAGVVAEAVYAGIRVRPILRGQLREAEPSPEPLTMRVFLHFYVPLSLTSFIFLIERPIAAGSLGRMPAALNSLAAWPVVTGLIFLLRGIGVAFNEVVVALVHERGAAVTLRRFAIMLAGGITLCMAVAAAPPISGFWFREVSGLSVPLTLLCQTSIWLGVLLPALSVFQSWSQGVILYSHRTRSLTEAVVLFFVMDVGLLTAGVAWGGVDGIYVGLVSLTVGELSRNLWLRWRSRSTRLALQARDAAPATQA